MFTFVFSRNCWHKWKGFPQNNCSIVLSTESISKIHEKCQRKNFFLVKLQAYLATLPKMNSFTSILQRFWPKNSEYQLALSGCFRIPTIFLIGHLGSFKAIIKLLNGLLNSLSKERCFHREKYLDMHWDLWQPYLWKHRYHPLVKLHSIRSFLFQLFHHLT